MSRGAVTEGEMRMRVFIALLGLVACGRSKAEFHVEATDATVTDASVTDGSAGATATASASVERLSSATAATNVSARTCDDLTDDEKTALEDCALSRFGAALGYAGAFTARIETNGTELPRVRTTADIQPNKFRTALRGDVCDRAAALLARPTPCAWDVDGPFSKWTITTRTPSR